MSYFLGAIFPFLMIIAGIFLLVLGTLDPHTHLAIAGAILLSGAIIALSISPIYQSRKQQ